MWQLLSETSDKKFEHIAGISNFKIDITQQPVTQTDFTSGATNLIPGNSQLRLIFDSEKISNVWQQIFLTRALDHSINLYQIINQKYKFKCEVEMMVYNLIINEQYNDNSKYSVSLTSNGTGNFTQT